MDKFWITIPSIIILETIHRRDRKVRREKPFREKKKKERSATSAFAKGESPPIWRTILAG